MNIKKNGRGVVWSRTRAQEPRVTIGLLLPKENIFLNLPLFKILMVEIVHLAKLW